MLFSVNAHLTPAIGAAFILILGGSVLATRAGSDQKTRSAPPPVGHEAADDGAPPPVRTKLKVLLIPNGPSGTPRA